MSKKTIFHPTMLPPLPALSSIGLDGIDHIRVHPNGAHPLGRFLSDYTRRNNLINHPVLGGFNSVANFLAWFKSGNLDDNLRTMEPNKLSKFMAHLRANGIQPQRRPHLYALYCEIVWAKLLGADKKTQRAILENNIPFDMYDIVESSGVMYRPEEAGWKLACMNEAIRAACANEEPMSSKFRSLGGDFYAFVAIAK